MGDPATTCTASWPSAKEALSDAAASHWQVIEDPGPEWDYWVRLCVNADVYHTSGYVAAMKPDRAALPRLFVFQSSLGTVVHPLLLRPLAGLGSRFADLYDATTCYGYGGPTWAVRAGASESALLREFWSGEAKLLRGLGVVCEFVRLHPLLPRHDSLPEECALVWRGQTVAIDLARPPAALLRGLSANHRRCIKKARRAGIEVTFSDRPEELDAFAELYVLTMIRVGARREYFFPRSSFRNLFALLPRGSVWLASARLQGRIIAAYLILCGKTFAHYHLGASHDDARSRGANHLLMFESLLFAQSLGRTRMHLGGGYGARNDGLLRFKRGFGGSLCPFQTVERIILPKAYRQVCQAMGVEPRASTYFPAYRDPTVSALEQVLAWATDAWSSGEG